MPQRSLRENPLWRAEDLGKPIPLTPHALSVCLPRWRDVVGYEEKDPETMKQLALGYPRFLYHPYVQRLFDTRRRENEGVQIYSTTAAAERCRAFVLAENPAAEVTIDDDGVTLRYPAESEATAKAYWQHAGEGISSRQAEHELLGTPAPDDSAARAEVVERIAEFSGGHPEDIFLYPSGMAAIFAAFLAADELRPNHPAVQFAFPYGDTLKLIDKMGAEPALFYPRGDDADFAALEKRLAEGPINGLFCEFPTNPLLTCVDLPRLRALADEHAFPLIIDETLGACVNQNTYAVSDVSAISLTKFFSGTSDVMGGALIVNPATKKGAAMRERIAAAHDPAAYFAADVIRLAEDSRCCRERVRRTNVTALALCEHLRAHPAVESVYYPAYTDRDTYDAFRRPDGGYGGLFSFVMKNAETVTEKLYDALEITKGPNLGTSFSLCCPFTLLAHYDELDWAESAGASRWLIRVSTGLESAEELIARLDRAISAAIHA